MLQLDTDSDQEINVFMNFVEAELVFMDENHIFIKSGTISKMKGQ